MGALIAEPVFLLADSAIVGHLGTPQLAGMSVASAVLLNIVLLCIFLSYGTTSIVARMAGSGDLRAALGLGLDALWLALIIGLGCWLLGEPLASTLVRVLGTPENATAYAETYLRISLVGVPFMLVVLAASGVMRGLNDTRTPMLVVAVAAAANIALNLVLVYPVGLGVAGSALGTVLAQGGAATWLTLLIVRRARQVGAELRPRTVGIVAALRMAGPLLTRTVLLRIALLIMTFVAAAQGEVALAAHQVAFMLWFFLAIPPEAFGIAGQTLVAHALGAGAVGRAHEVARRSIAWGLAAGLLMAALVLALRPGYVPVFTGDQAVRDQIWSLVVVVALTQPIGALVYILDGILIGAGDGGYLAWTMLVALLAFLPLAAAVYVSGAGIVALWWALAGWLLARQVTIYLRYRSDKWVVTGAMR